MKELKVNKVKFGDLGGRALEDCLFNIERVDANECNLSQKMTKRLKKHAKHVGCRIYCKSFLTSREKNDI